MSQKPAKNSFQLELLRLVSSYNVDQFYGDFVDLALHAASDGAIPCNDRSKAEAVVGDLCAAYFETVCVMPAFHDILSDAFMQAIARSGRSGMGQFFTPSHMADLMACLAGPVDFTRKDTQGLSWISDSCCGTGSLLLAALRQVYAESGAKGLLQIGIQGNDLDLRCIKSAALQILTNARNHQLPIGRIILTHGDALSPASGRIILNASAMPVSAPVVEEDHCPVPEIG